MNIHTALAKAGLKPNYFQPDFMLDLKSIGCKVDGTTDDTDAFLAGVAQTGTRGTLVLPQGTTSSSEMVLDSIDLAQRRISLVGVHEGGFNSGVTSRVSSIKLKSGVNGNQFNFVAGSTPVQSIHIKNIAFNGNKANQSGTSHCLYFPTYVSGEDNFTRIEDCYIHDFLTDCVNSEYGRRNIEIWRTQFYNSRNAWFCSSSDASLIMPIIGSMSQDAVQVHDWTFKIIGGNVFACRNGINTFAGEANLTEIIGVMLDRHQQSGVVLNGKLAIVDGCAFHQNGLAAQGTYATVNIGGDNNVVVNNVFRGPATGGLNLPIYDILQAANTTNTVANNETVAGASVGGHFRCGDNAITKSGVVNINRRTAITAASSFVVPASHLLEHITIQNTTANAITGGLKFGTTVGGTDVVVSIAIPANSYVSIPTSDILKVLYSVSSDTTIYFDAVTSWNSASIRLAASCKAVPT